MPWHIGDYFADTLHLTTEQHGAYLLLIAAYWRAGSALPDNDDRLMSITKLKPSKWHKHKPVLMAFFSVSDAKWFHKRIENELKIASENARKSSDAARARWLKNKETEHADASLEHMLGRCPTPTPTPEPSVVDAVAREPFREVVEAMGENHTDPKWFSHSHRVRAWMDSGASLDDDILPIVRTLTAKLGHPPNGLKYFEAAIMNHRVERLQPVANGKANGHGQNRRQNGADSSHKLRAGLAATFADVAGESPADRPERTRD